jgi:hypothetical protein
MPLLANQKVEITVYCKAAEQSALNVLYYRINGYTGAGPTEQQLIDAWTTYIRAYYLPLMAATSSFQGAALRVADAVPFGGYYFKKHFALGTAGSDLMARQVAGLISHRTAVGGRHGRGRSYIPFPDEVHNTTAGLPAAAYMTALDTLASKLQTSGAMVYSGADTVTLQLQVRNRLTNTYTPVDHWVTPTKWATQRRRGSFGKANQPPDAIAT